MQQHPDYGRLFSASDLAAHLGCQHRTTLDLRRLEGWNEQPGEPDAATQLLQTYGDRHETNYLQVLRAQGVHVVEIDKNAPLSARLEATQGAMRKGAAVIYQAALLESPFLGYADFLVRIPGKSNFGDYQYDVADTKLAKSNQAKFVVQLGLYALVLEKAQGVLPTNLDVVLGENAKTASLRTQECIHYIRDLCAGFIDFVNRRPETRALPNSACGSCRWLQHCEAEWVRHDHVCLVANIRRSQIEGLEQNDIRTMSQLANLPENEEVAGVNPASLSKLRKQAELQKQPTDAEGRLRLEYLPKRPDGPTSGFEWLPEPDPADLYFDMEGFPHEPGGLEYLFGLGWRDKAAADGYGYRSFWAHNRVEEKRAFEDFMDFVESHLANHPNAHIYHYAPYERTVIERLSESHDTRRNLRDRLFRERRLVDLYRVVRQGLLLALPSYSIKKVESYYGFQRAGNVANGGESVVVYEAFRTTGDATEKQNCLNAIEAYNREDVVSTGRLHEWLESLRTTDTCRPAAVGPEEEPSEAQQERLRREQAAIEMLTAWKGKGDGSDATRHALAELLGYLLGFYWRCKLATIWRNYAREKADPEELLNDLDCLAMLESTGKVTKEKLSYRYEFRVPEQESRLESGAKVECITDKLSASGFVYDENIGIASFTRKAKLPPPPRWVTLCESDDFSPAPKLDAIYRYVERLCTDTGQPDALKRFLSHSLPAIQGCNPGDALVTTPEFEPILKVVENLDRSHLVIQGPPGSGKTTLASKIIARLLADGKKVAITSNSHAAINHLLKAAWQRSREQGQSFSAAVVKADDTLPPEIKVVQYDKVDAAEFPLVGGTAWLFCRPEQESQWDYLFVDEASQVSLADLVAAGSCAKNIVLLGDQMQLPQPIQGIHPGESGLSALEFVMQGQATVPPEQGIFLAKTYRMHPAVCLPISEGVYEGRLVSDTSCAQQQLVLAPDADPALRENGVVWLPVVHANRSQRAPEEAERIKALYRSLLGQQWIDQKGGRKPVRAEDILVLAPYNAQVRLLKRTLGEAARVGTVDKFQGQEAAVAIVSMTTSDADSMPRGLDFLFSINRLNVAVSRARCLAVVVASPAMRTPPCGTVEDVKRVSFFSRLAAAGAKVDTRRNIGKI